MTPERIYKKISRISNQNSISKPYIVGGIPRDLYRGKLLEYNDIDLTTNSSDIMRLGVLCAESFRSFFRVFSDGHMSVYLKDYALDFSSNFVSRQAEEHLAKEGMSDEYLKEVYSRDFTINTLHIDIETGELTDPTNMGKEDISRGIIRSVISPEASLLNDPNRIFRAIELSSRLGFDIDDDIINFVISNNDMIKNELDIKEAFIENIIGKSIGNNSQKTLESLMEMNILDMVPLSGSFKQEVIKRRMVKDYLDISES
jgi:poly(A) polymerase